MSNLKFKPGAEVFVLEGISRHDGDEWVSDVEERAAVYHSHDSAGIWVEVVEGEYTKLSYYTFGQVISKE